MGINASRLCEEIASFVWSRYIPPLAGHSTSARSQRHGVLEQMYGNCTVKTAKVQGKTQELFGNAIVLQAEYILKEFNHEDQILSFGRGCPARPDHERLRTHHRQPGGGTAPA